jgi:excisionase family DNA binding protein
MDASKPAPPLSTRECADLIGVSTDFILDAIKDGALRAERLQRRPGARAIYRVFEEDFLGWLKASGWSRMPQRRVG